MTSLRLMAVALTALLSSSALHAQQSAIPQTSTSAQVPARAWPEAYPAETGTGLAAQISTLLADPTVSRAHWGIAVTATDGTPIYGLDEAKLFRPASTAKLFTTAAAMAILGPQHTVNTDLYGDLDSSTGVLKGDLSLVGGGDPSFNTTDLPYRATRSTAAEPNDLAALADRLVAQGLHQITGDIVGDDSLFGHEAPPEGWEAEDLMWGFGALPSALSIGDNELRLTIAPGDVHFPVAPGTNISAQLTIDQLAPYLTLQNEVTTGPPDTKPAAAITFPPLSEPTRHLEIFGSIAEGTPPLNNHLAVPDSAQYAAEALKQMLLQRGVQVDGTAHALHAITATSEPYLRAWRAGDGSGRASAGPPKGYAFSCPGTAHSLHLLAAHTSAPLLDDITFTLKTSANLHAELFVRQLGLQNSCPGASAVNGARMIRTWLLHAGIAPEDFVLYDGSGLSVKDLVSPRAEAQLLAYAAQQPWFTQWKAALPIGGVDGTLEARFKDAPLKGHVFAKTGTLGESRALAGYLDAASGKQILFSIMVDNHEPGTSADRATMDKIVAAIAATN